MAGEVTVGLASPWPCVIHLQAQGLRKGDEQWHNTFYLYYTDALSYVSYHTNMSLLIELDYT